MPTNPNMVAIQTVTVGAGGAANIEFTSIPQTYTDLYVVTSLRVSSTDITSYVYFNNSTSSYTRRVIYGDGSSATSASASDAGVLWTNQSNNTASTFGSTSIYIPNYTGSNNKSASIDFVTENNATTAYAAMNAFLWSNTSAITSVKLVPNSGTYVQYSTATLYGVTSAATAAKATGGIITMDANYFYHTFLASGTFTPTSNITADYLVVAGGGGGGSLGGGGGAGGLRSTVTATGGGGSLESAVSFTNGTAYTVTVGAGGTGSPADTFNGTSGSNSSISGTGLTTITSTGGGRGGNNGGALTGGSGGGGGNSSPGAAGTANQGYAGGGVSPGNSAGSGGGGAGSVGANANTGTNAVGGNGGSGVSVAITGSSVAYAGGGGGSGRNDGGGSTAGGTASAGGGAGGASNSNGSAGTGNTGGGGGGGGYNGTFYSGGNGGSGIIVIRYAK